MIRDGKLAEARAGLVETVKSVPTDTKARTLLFQILVCYGEWDKAEKHLELLIMQSPQNATGLLLYRSLVAAEKLRQSVFKGASLPDFMTPSPPFLPDFLEMRKCFAAGDGARGVEYLAAIEAVLPPVHGEADGIAFSGIVDADSSLFCFLEAFIHDRYLWFPFTAIREMTIRAPESFLDLIWAPARIVTWEGLTCECYLPVLYPQSCTHEDDLVKMGRMTAWHDLSGGCYRGVGQHLICLGAEEKGLLDLRELTFHLAEQEVSQ